MEIILILLIFSIIYFVVNKINPFRVKNELPNSNTLKHKKSDINAELIQSRINNIMTTITTQSTSNKYSDESIIDVTDKACSIKSDNNINKFSTNVPYWAHHYVYSHTELEDATGEQKNFYNIFKSSFLNGEYLDLEGNTNYAFILLFDLLTEFDNHKDLPKLEQQLKSLGQHYPKTKSYGISFLIQKLEAIGDNNSVARLKLEDKDVYQIYNTEYDFWRLGSRFKDKLSLNDEQVELLNKLWYPNNNFCSIEYCCIEILKLYISVVKEFKANCVSEGTTIEALFSGVADVIARKQFRYKNGSQNYKYCIETTSNDFYSHIFRFCENAVRERYGHKRKINTDTNYTAAEAKAEYETKIISKILNLISSFVSDIISPDKDTEIELYSQNTNRWKIKFEELTINYNGDPNFFLILLLHLEN